VEVALEESSQLSSSPSILCSTLMLQEPIQEVSDSSHCRHKPSRTALGQHCSPTPLKKHSLCISSRSQWGGRALARLGGAVAVAVLESGAATTAAATGRVATGIKATHASPAAAAALAAALGTGVATGPVDAIVAAPGTASGALRSIRSSLRLPLHDPHPGRAF
jgi:hypothetical protein